MNIWPVLKNLWSEDPPHKVVETKYDAYTSRGVLHRGEGLILYLPNSNSSKRDTPIFEIVLHKTANSHLPRQAFSLYRAKTRDDAELKFLILKDKLPEFIDISVEMCTTAGLQKICDTLYEHPQWSLAHLAAHFALYDCLNNPKISNFLNSADEVSGVSPLQVAIASKNLRTVQLLVGANCSLEHLDRKKNSIYHYAANSTKEIVAVLAQDPPLKCLNSRNNEGLTPLHKACSADNTDCVLALLKAGADVNRTAALYEGEENLEPSYVHDYVETASNDLYRGDMKSGGTPLHWACSKTVVETLIDRNCYINMGNFQKRTALHIMVLRRRLDCAVALLSRGADPNLGDNEGNRPLHFAAQVGCIPIIQCLVIFGADLDILNNAGESARHLISPKLLYYLSAIGAKRCSEDMTNCKDGCKYDGTYEGIPPPPVPMPTNRDTLNEILMEHTLKTLSEKYEDAKLPQKGRLLCLDGGGIRGLILVQCLLELEDVLQKPIVHLFDWIAGTSTGGILALAIASGRTMKECLCLYFRLKEQTFVGMRPYPSDILENILKETFGSDTVMTNIDHPKIIVTGTLADRKPAELHLFRNYESPSSILKIEPDSSYEPPAQPGEQLIWEAARATGAAPTYYRAFGKYLDGGLIANNPTLDALTEIEEHCLALKAMNRESEAAPVSLVVSIGTGHIPVIEVRNMDMYRPDSFVDNARLVFGISALGTLLVDQATSSDGRVVDRARSWCASIGVPYFRFSPHMSEEFPLNEKDDEKLCKMLWETKVYMRKKSDTLKKLADLLNNQ
ncbi:85/88 kDa calcium-independent phospholipase A2 isoform X2 [Coccinella septempunctata]|uniref:85/88 kDa calcium-independent phospholipase A2 isoform X2 n=1 Tax=Coccinella septempunctata TaxID=41139 RepID=UPI001D088F7E|nr:85/88 kDa calcium-independent phospholipase A2 isoform X2 [Coccinella septempunctata]